MRLQRLPVDAQTFADIRTRGELYVDKTAYILRMLESGRYYFLSRPRRFGKSLTVTTLKAFFEGRKALFEGLALAAWEDWTPHPVIHLDFATLANNDADLLSRQLAERLAEQCSINGVVVSPEQLGDDVGNALYKAVQAIAEQTGRRIALLIDEYDKPITDQLEQPETADRNRDVLRKFFIVAKSLDAQLRFVFLTGVSKFAKVSVFSGLNNMQDITMDPRFNAVVGFTQTELEQNFDTHLNALAAVMQVEKHVLLAQMRELYNGYSWDGVEKVYNPFSVVRVLHFGRLGYHWFSSGTPAFLVDELRRREILPPELENIHIHETGLESSDIRHLPMEALLFQTGYLTVSHRQREGFDLFYRLNFPNQEVRSAFLGSLLPAYTGTNPAQTQPDAAELRRLLAAGNVEPATHILARYIAHIPGKLHIPAERYYQSLVYMALSLAGMKVDMERWVAGGILDGVLELPERVWFIEFKYAKKGNAQTLAGKAVQQIIDKDYAGAWKNSGKKRLALGIAVAGKQTGFDWRELAH